MLKYPCTYSFPSHTYGGRAGSWHCHLASCCAQMSVDSPFLVSLSITRGHLPLCHPSAQPGSLHPHPIADSCCWGLPRPLHVCMHGTGAEAENPAGSFLPSHEHPLHYLLVSSWGFCSISPPKKRPVLLCWAFSRLFFWAVQRARGQLCCCLGRKQC